MPLLLLLLLAQDHAQSNYDEAKVPKYTLPDPLVMKNGQPVKSAKDWTGKRRAEVFDLFATQVYGRTPAKKLNIVHEVRSVDRSALGGKAIRKEVSILFSGKKDGPSMDLLIYLPANARGPVPVVFGLNFNGNQTTQSDEGITVSKAWTQSGQPFPRGSQASRWQVEMAISRGYGVATAYYGDIDPDFDDGFQNGVHPLFQAPGQKPGPDEWGSLGAWAWGMSRAMDYFEKDRDIDAKHVALTGHSRIGKAALWAGAQDARFAVVIANESGEGGAALARREFGERTKRINTSFPHWFADNYTQYNERESAMPVDQHMLLALIAPRPVYVCSAEEDRWADPRGEFLSLVAADPVYRLLGTEGLGGVTEMPGIHQPILRHNGYHIRAGKHDVTAYDWEQWLNFLDRHWRSKR